MIALAEQLIATANYDYEAAYVLSRETLKQAVEFSNSNAEAVVRMLQANILLASQGRVASEASYRAAVGLFDGNCSPELQFIYLITRFHRDSAFCLAEEQDRYIHAALLAGDNCSHLRLKMLGKLEFLKHRALAGQVTIEEAIGLKDELRSNHIDDVFLVALDGVIATCPPTIATAYRLADRRELIAESRRVGLRPMTIQLLLEASERAAAEERLADAHEHMDAALDLSRAYHCSDVLITALMQKSNLDLSSDDVEAASASIEEALQLADAIVDPDLHDRLYGDALSVFLALNDKGRMQRLTDALVQSRRKMQATVEKYAEMLDEASDANRRVEDSSTQLRDRSTRLAEIYDRLASDRSVAESQRDTYQWISTTGFLVASCLAAFLFFSRLRLRRTLQLLREEADARAKTDKIRATLEGKVAQAERMESLGALAGGIAHDLNNLLVGVLCNAEMLSTPTNEEVRTECVDGIIHSAMTAADLTEKMLSYAGKGPQTKEYIDVNQLVENISPLLKTGLNLEHEVKLDTSQSLTANIDRTQFEQVIINLATNAAAATPPDRGPAIIRTGCETIEDVEQDHALFGSRTSGGEFVFIEFEDQGIGIREEDLPRVFEPFYSSKESGKGLGLSVVYGHVVSHNGLIRCQSQVGEGTTIRILVPKSAAGAMPVGELRDGSGARSGATVGRVVVIDDDKLILEAITRCLTLNRWEVVAFNSAAQALEYLITQGDGVSCLFIDMKMPELTGDKVLEAIIKMNLEVPVVMMSGYRPASLQRLRSRPQVKYTLEKPFTSAELLAALAAGVGQHV
jgi:signal transduction histidine kinase